MAARNRKRQRAEERGRIREALLGWAEGLEWFGVGEHGAQPRDTATVRRDEIEATIRRICEEP